MDIVFAGLMIAVSLTCIMRAVGRPASFVRHFSRGAYMRDVARSMEERRSGSPIRS